MAPSAARLRTQLDEQQAASEEQDVRRFIDLTTRFHRSFVEVAGNQVLLELSERLADRPRLMLFRLGPTLLDRCQSILDEHRQLVDARDPQRFADTLRRHINDVHTARSA